MNYMRHSVVLCKNDTFGVVENMIHCPHEFGNFRTRQWKLFLLHSLHHLLPPAEQGSRKINTRLNANTGVIKSAHEWEVSCHSVSFSTALLTCTWGFSPHSLTGSNPCMAEVFLVPFFGIPWLQQHSGAHRRGCDDK